MSQAFIREAGGSDSRAFNVCGVDIPHSNPGPLVMEVNASPGLGGEKTTGNDVTSMIIELTEKNAKPHRTHTRGKG